MVMFTVSILVLHIKVYNILRQYLTTYFTQALNLWSFTLGLQSSGIKGMDHQTQMCLLKNNYNAQ